MTAAAADRATILGRLGVVPLMLREMSRDCAPAEAWRPPVPGAWSIGEVVRHLTGLERDAFLPRLGRMLAETRPVFDAITPAADGPADLPALLDAFEALRRETTAILGRLDEAGWLREGVSPRLGPLTVERLAGVMSDHDTEHLRQIQDVRAALGLPPRRCEARLALPLPELVAALEGAARRLETAASGLDGAALRRRPAEGEWSIEEVMAHLLHVERELFLPRLRRIAAEDAPVFAPFSPDAWAREDHRRGRFADDLAAFAAARRETVAFLQGLGAADLARPAVSAFFGPLTLGQYATHIADHDLDHLRQIEACRRTP